MTDKLHISPAAAYRLARAGKLRGASRVQRQIRVSGQRLEAEVKRGHRGRRGMTAG